MNPFFESLSVVLVIVLAILGVILAGLAVLMPYFVWKIHSEVEGLRKIAESNQESGPVILNELIEALRAGSELRTEVESALVHQQRTLTALVEQQRTINALRQRLDKLQGETPPSDQSAPPGR